MRLVGTEYELLELGMFCRVAHCAQGNKISLFVHPAVGSWPLVVHLQAETFTAVLGAVLIADEMGAVHSF